MFRYPKVSLGMSRGWEGNLHCIIKEDIGCGRKFENEEKE